MIYCVIGGARLGVKVDLPVYRKKSWISPSEEHRAKTLKPHLVGSAGLYCLIPEVFPIAKN